MTAFATSYLVGLDLGPPIDPSGLAVLEAHEQDRGDVVTDRRLALRHLRRWPRGAGYAEIGRDLSALLGNPPLTHATLVVDLVRDQAIPHLGAWRILRTSDSSGLRSPGRCGKFWLKPENTDYFLVPGELRQALY